MNVSLTSDLDSWVHGKVKNGFYNSASEVVRESLRLLKERDQQKQILLAELKSELRLGLKQIETGLSEDFTEKTVACIKLSGRKKLVK
ncbi:MAG: type II toxin-antitoxin system ParD family antitoxin [Victivallales bacterium]